MSDYLYKYLWPYTAENQQPPDNPQNLSFTLFGAEEYQAHISIRPASKAAVDLVFGGADMDYYSVRNNRGWFWFNDSDNPNNYHILDRVHLWPTHWANHVYIMINHSPKLIDDTNLVDSNVNKLYMCLNNRRKLHRCELIDALHSAKLLELGAVSWHNGNENHYQYHWKSWTPEILRLDANHVKWSAFPEEASTTLLSVIGESTIDVVFITEKTWLNIFQARPFLVIGAKGFHATLEKFGFQLYSELFDYSFDNLDSVTDRIAGVITNLKVLAGRDYNYLRSIIKDKAIYNRERAIEIARSKEYVPTIVIEHIKNLEKSKICDKSKNSYVDIVNNLT